MTAAAADIPVTQGDAQMKAEIRDGMRIDWDAPIRMDDGLVLRADVFRPAKAGRYPVLMTYGPYGKGLAFQEGYKTCWDLMVKEYPDTAAGSTNKYQSWEVVDPEKWVPQDYVVIRVDSRGAGRSPGYMDHHNARENKDFHDCIEWAAQQPWSNGNVGLNGISYFACNQWRAAATQPPSLKAICVWEGWADRYRDSIYHGGILNVYQKHWQTLQIKTVQHGRGVHGAKNPVTGDLVCGPETLTEEEMKRNIAPLWEQLTSNKLDGPYWRERSGDFSKVTVPLLSSGNWGGQGLHLRGNVEGFVRSASKEKWLEMHGGSHWAIFYTDYGVDLQRRFFDYYLKGEKNGWERQPKVQLQIRYPGERFELRHESEWPIARTKWTRMYLDPQGEAFTETAPAQAGTVTFDAMGDGIIFKTPPMPKNVEITGPLAAKLWVSSSTADADIFLVVRVFDPEGKEVTFHGAVDPHTPIAQGWLRASHRKLDPELSLPYRPYHTHDEHQPLRPGEVYELDVEIWPTCIVVPKGYTLALHVRGKDYDYDGEAAFLSNMGNPLKGCGPFSHDDVGDRPPSIYGGKTTLHVTPSKEPYVLVPIIPKT
jgi:predicted acyl esterase